LGQIKDTIVFERAKTSGSGDDVDEITVIITRQIGRILDRLGSKPAYQDQYIFPILQKGMNPEQKERTITQQQTDVNLLCIAP
jgi:integrase/recombinase XerD